MRIIEVENYEKLSKITADLIAAQVILKPNSVLGLATGSSPLGTYEALIKENKTGTVDFSNVRTVNLDEYYGLTPDHPQSYRYFMDQNLFNHINIDKGNTYVPDGMANDIDAESAGYEALINELGGVDLQLLGIGNNGHIAFNEPCDYFPRYVHRVELTESTIQANSRLFDKIEEVPTQAMTMGIGTIMKAKKIVIIAGSEKKEIMNKAIYGDITPQIPASVLQLHSDVVVVTVK